MLEMIDMELPAGDNSDDFADRPIWYFVARARQFFHAMAPKEYDPTNVRFAKETLRWSSALAGAAAVVVVVLDPGPPDEV